MDLLQLLQRCIGDEFSSPTCLIKFRLFY